MAGGASVLSGSVPDLRALAELTAGLVRTISPHRRTRRQLGERSTPRILAAAAAATIAASAFAFALACLPRSAPGQVQCPAAAGLGPHKKPALLGHLGLQTRFAAGAAELLPRSGCPSAVVRQLDASTKWLVTLAQTAAVVWRHDLASPFMVIGAVLAAYLTTLIKRVVNQRRPPGAPFMDPGMPSSHALVSTFITIAWILHVPSVALAAALLPAAGIISVLRVACGYHTWAQIAVGVVMGGIMAMGWMSFGATCVLPRHGVSTTAIIYALYFAGSVLFIARQLRRDKIRRAEVPSSM